MPDRRSAGPIIRSKLERPSIPKDAIDREAQFDRVNETNHTPLVLVSAPAGYGKTTFVNLWLDGCAQPVAWLTLDESDSNLRRFLHYVVAAVQTARPGTCGYTVAQLRKSVLPPVPILAAHLSNDVEELEAPLTLVLDDYHQIKEPAVHELIDQFLKYPSARLQLVIISRFDPPLSLGVPRARNMLAEVRVNELKFALAEARTFLQKTLGDQISGATVEHLQQITEGWAAGLRLASLAARHHTDREKFLLNFHGADHLLKDFLFAEVLSHQLPITLDYLCRTSIFERFSAPLCEVIGVGPGDGQGNTGLDSFGASTFMRLLEEGGLFDVALDASGEWYRYHPIFKEVLQQLLQQRLGPDGIASLHRNAAVWFEAHGWLDEAFDHFLLADGAAGASQLIVRHRNDILSMERWDVLDGWLQRLPPMAMTEDPELLVMRAWDLQNRGRPVEVLRLLGHIEEVLSSDAAVRLRGSINTLRSYLSYLEAQADLALQFAEQALTELPPDCVFERGFAFMSLAGAMRMRGDMAGARKIINAALADTSVPVGIFQCRMLMTLCFLDWHTPDLPALRQTANRYFNLGEELGLPESCTTARYFLGTMQYQLNEIAEAGTSLIPVIAGWDAPNLRLFADCAFTLASVYQASGQADKARETVDSIREHLGVQEWAALQQRVDAYQADLALRQGRMDMAMRWAENFDPEPFANIYLSFEPRMTLVKVRIVQDTADSRTQADILLTRLETFVAAIHNMRFLIEVFALRALLQDAEGDEAGALSALSRAVKLARPSGIIRLFVDLGPGLVKLLKSLDLDAEGLAYVGRITSAFSEDGVSAAAKLPGQLLTKREREILRLFADDLSNKKISSLLRISAATVKRHAENVYQKLGVHSRRQAVAKALELTII